MLRTEDDAIRRRHIYNVLTVIPVFVLLYLGTIAFMTFVSIRRMQATPEILPAPEVATEVSAKLPKEIADFLVVEGFREAEFYRFHQITIGIWSQAGGPPLQHLDFMRTPLGNTFEFVAEFSDQAALTTSKSRAAFMYPRPSRGFLQSFPKADIRRLWDIHLQGTQFLIANSAVSLSQCRQTFPERSRRGMLKQLACVRSLPLWPIRGIYWFLVKRFLLRNRPIWKQDIARLYPPISEKNHPA